MDQFLTINALWACFVLAGLFVVFAAVQMMLETRKIARIEQENAQLRKQISSLRDHQLPSLSQSGLVSARQTTTRRRTDEPPQYLTVHDA
ncbi:MAG: hypothetical protein H7332_02970 [Bdellovibrionales bacterium]|nr:hypothetical protein [Ramlibacter sp.]